MKTEAKTASAGMGIQLMAVIGQCINKLNLNYDEMKQLVDRPNIAHERLKALKGESIVATTTQTRFAKLEPMNIEPSERHRWVEGADDLVILGRNLKRMLEAEIKPIESIRFEGSRSVWKCTALSDKHNLFPVFRDALDYHDTDEGIWSTLFERGCLWTVVGALSFVYDIVHEGKDPLGLANSHDEVLFPVVLSTKEDSINRFEKNVGTVDFLSISLGHKKIRQQDTWFADTFERDGWLGYSRKIVFFANDPRAPSKK